MSYFAPQLQVLMYYDNRFANIYFFTAFSAEYVADVFTIIYLYVHACTHDCFKFFLISY
jgi:hypothetical protein